MAEELLYEGKAKKVFIIDEEGLLLHRYKDDATAFNAQKRGSWRDKGKTNATMSATIFAYLEERGIRTHFRELGVSDEDLKFCEELGLKVNQVLAPFFDQRGITLVDFKIEVGRDAEGRLLLADEISPDTCRFWDKKTGEKLDKDRFRHDMGGVEEAYAEVLRRVTEVKERGAVD